MIVDPLENMAINVGSYDVEREASVYFDTSGLRCWTKAWFNGRDKGEKSIEITRQQAIQFINHQIAMDDWLSRYYPKQMTAYHKAIEQARQQILGFQLIKLWHKEINIKNFQRLITASANILINTWLLQ